MLRFQLNLLSIFILSLDANFNVISRTPSQTMFLNTQQFQIEIDQITNRPNFSSSIKIHTNTTTTTSFEVNVHTENTTVIYSKKTLTFHTPENLTWDENSEYYITFDEGVLYSNNNSSSTAQTSPNFWSLVVISTTTVSPNTKPSKYPIGERSPPYSTRLGIGVGITCLIVLFLLEVLYFIYCYHGQPQRGNYSP